MQSGEMLKKENIRRVETVDMQKAIAAIEQQQKEVKERSAAWMVGEQLKDICRREPNSAALIAQDLQVKEMHISQAEKQIKKFADANKVGNFACVTPLEAEKILREFYGLEQLTEEKPKMMTQMPDDNIVSIFDLL